MRKCVHILKLPNGLAAAIASSGIIAFVPKSLTALLRQKDLDLFVIIVNKTLWVCPIIIVTTIVNFVIRKRAEEGESCLIILLKTVNPKSMAVQKIAYLNPK